MLNIHKKLTISIFSFLAASACLVTSTFAWYSLGDQVVVDNLSVGVKAEDQIQVGFTSYGSFMSDIDSALFDTQSGVNPEMKFEPVSSLYSEGDEEYTKPSLHSRYFYNNFSHIDDTVAITGFYDFDLYFLCAHDTYVYLSNETTVTANEEENASIAEERGLDASKLNKVAKALRVGIYADERPYRIYEPNVETSSNTLLAGRLNVLSKDQYFDFDLSTKKEYMFGKYTCDELIYDEEARSSEISGDISCFNSYSHPDAIPLDIDKSVADGGLVIAKEKTQSLSELSDKDSNNYLVYAEGNKPTRINIRIYLEGWDLDCIDEILYSKFNVNLSFTGVYGRND